MTIDHEDLIAEARSMGLYGVAASSPVALHTVIDRPADALEQTTVPLQAHHGERERTMSAELLGAFLRGQEARRRDCSQPCEHISQHDASEGRTCAEHPCTCTDRENRRAGQ